jgi:hypothetical protein
MSPESIRTSPATHPRVKRMRSMLVLVEDNHAIGEGRYKDYIIEI